MEYESLIKRHFPKLTEQQVNDFLDYICAASRAVKVYYLWRPYLKDPADDMVLELAIASKSDYIVTYNQKDFKRLDRFGIKVVTAKELLELIEE